MPMTSAYPTYFSQPVMPYYQQQVPQQRQAAFVGRLVQSESEIAPNDVPMDGSIGIFPYSDFSTIIGKQWQSDGTIKTIKFVPYDTVTPVEATPTTDESVIDDILKRLDSIEASMHTKSRGNRSGSKSITSPSSN